MVTAISLSQHNFPNTLILEIVTMVTAISLAKTLILKRMLLWLLQFH